MDRYFIDLVLDHINKGIVVFSDETWFHMVNMVNERFDIQYDKQMLQIRFVWMVMLLNFSSMMGLCGMISSKW